MRTVSRDKLIRSIKAIARKKWITTQIVIERKIWVCNKTYYNCISKWQMSNKIYYKFKIFLMKNWKDI